MSSPGRGDMACDSKGALRFGRQLHDPNRSLLEHLFVPGARLAPSGAQLRFLRNVHALPPSFHRIRPVVLLIGGTHRLIWGVALFAAMSRSKALVREFVIIVTEGSMAKGGTREKILQSAYRCFYEVGYNGTSVQDVVDSVGAPKGTFYNHFKSKEDLALEVLNLYAQQADSVYLAPVPPPRKRKTASGCRHLDFLRSRFLAIVEFLEGASLPRACLMGSFISESLEMPASFRPTIQQSFERWIDAISSILEAAKLAGEIERRADCKALARYIFAAWQGALVLARAEGARTAIDVFLNQTFNVLLKAPSPRPSKRAAETRVS